MYLKVNVSLTIIHNKLPEYQVPDVKGNEKVVITEVILINPSIDSTTTPKPSISFAVGIHQKYL